MRAVLFFILVLLASGLFAADMYVDHTNAGAEDGTAKTPYNTIGEAMTNVGDGDTIYLMNDAYSAAQVNADNYFYIADARSNTGKSFTVDVDGVSSTTITVSGTSAVQFVNDDSGYTITFKNITFTGMSTRVVLWGAGMGGNLIFEDCTFSGDITFTGTSNNTGTEVKTLVVDGCNYTGSSTASNLFLMRDITSLTIKDSTITDGGTGDVSMVLLLDAGSLYPTISITGNTFTLDKHFLKTSSLNTGSLVFDNNTLTCGMSHTTTYGIYLNQSSAQNFNDVRITNNTWNVTGASNAYGPVHLTQTSPTVDMAGPIIHNNYLNATLAGYQGRGIYIGEGIEGASIHGNTVSGFEVGIEDHGLYTDTQKNIVKCTQGIWIYGAVGFNVINNTVLSVDGDEDGRACVLGRQVMAAESTGSAGDTFTATTYIDDDAWDLSEVTADGTMIAVAILDADTGTLAFDYAGRITAVNDGTDTVTVKEWVKYDGTIETPTADAVSVAVVRWPCRGRVLNNIFDGSRATYGVNFDYAPWGMHNYFDYNCIVSGSSSLSNIGMFGGHGSAITTFAAYQTEWATFCDTFDDNATNSISSTPQFTAVSSSPTFAADDASLKTTSPCLNTGYPYKGGYSTIGAWQPKYAIPLNKPAYSGVYGNN